MKKLFSMLFAFIALTLVSFSQPIFEIDGGFTYDWGKVKSSNDPLKAKIKFFNKGNDTLNVIEVKPGCGCTTAPLDKNKIEPGGFATLDVSLNAGNYDGDVTKSISIKTNDPNKGNSTLILKAYVWKPISILPKFFAFNKMFVNEETEAKVVLTNNTDYPVKITSITVEPQNLKLSLKEGDIIEAKKSIALDCKITPKETGRLNAQVNITTDNQEVGQLTITGYGNIVIKEEVPAPATPLNSSHNNH